MLLAIVVMTYTGVILFIAPPGRIANWANWEILGLTKTEYANLHSTMMVLFVLATVLHIYYNWRPITSYLSNSARQMVVFTKEMVVASLLVAVFVGATLSLIPPFSNFLVFGEDMKEGWEKEYGTAPYSHAELSSLEGFCKKLGFALEKSEEILKSNGIKYEITNSLSQIAEENSVSPQFIYTLLKTNFSKYTQTTTELSGLGKKQIKEIATTLGISTDEFILKLQKLGIEAKGDDKFKEIVEKYDMSPTDVINKMGYTTAK